MSFATYELNDLLLRLRVLGEHLNSELEKPESRRLKESFDSAGFHDSYVEMICSAERFARVLARLQVTCPSATHTLDAVVARDRHHRSMEKRARVLAHGSSK